MKNRTRLFGLVADAIEKLIKRNDGSGGIGFFTSKTSEAEAKINGMSMDGMGGGHNGSGSNTSKSIDTHGQHQGADIDHKASDSMGGGIHREQDQAGSSFGPISAHSAHGSMHPAVFAQSGSANFRPGNPAIG